MKTKQQEDFPNFVENLITHFSQVDDVFFCSHLGGPGMAVKDEGCEGASVTQQKSPRAQGEVVD